MVEIVSACAIALTLAQQVPVPAEPPDRRGGTLTGLYVSLAALQALDVHSTMSVLSEGGVEANPAMRGFTRHAASFIAVKAAATATTIWVTEKLRKKHPKGAVVLMVALNSVMAAVVANNYRH